MREYISFAQWVKQNRQAVELTQEALAQQVGCSAVGLRKIEAGTLRPSKALALRLITHFNVPPAEHAGFVAWARAVDPGPRDGRHTSARIETGTLMPGPAARHLWPVPLTSFVGREAELQQLQRLLTESETRLITIVGPPGAGKTRLAVQGVSMLPGRQAGSNVFVDLGAISDIAAVPRAITAALAAAGTPHGGAADMVLVLDNFEHALGAIEEVLRLLQSTPRLKVLVTSRIRLQVYGEHELPLAPFPVPDPWQAGDLATLAGYPSVALFVQRVQASSPAFQLTTENAADVAAICQQLEGLPLALELAAAQSRWFAPPALRARLEQRLAVLVGGARNLPLRQQTLRATLAWSYSLLPPAGQQLFARLAVFAGGWTAAAADAICREADETPVAIPTLTGLYLLADHSLIIQEEGANGEPWFRMLDTIREYAYESLIKQGDLAAVGARHAEYYLALAQTCTSPPANVAQRPHDSSQPTEYHNFRAAYTWLRETMPGREQPLTRLLTGVLSPRAGV